MFVMHFIILFNPEACARIQVSACSVLKLGFPPNTVDYFMFSWDCIVFTRGYGSVMISGHWSISVQISAMSAQLPAYD